MRILLLGKNGQVGWELYRRLPSLGTVTALGRRDLDLRDTDRIRSVVRQIEPQLIVNAAAYTAVDRAEAEPDQAMAVNATAPGVLAEEAEHLGAALIHYSTDYVFDGSKTTPYTERDTPNPLSVYGESKLLGERAIQRTGAPALILRLSWVYSMRRESFVSKVLNWAKTQNEMHIVDDQVSIPTPSRRAAKATLHALRWLLASHDFPLSFYGLFHMACAGAVSRFDWAQAILESNPGEIARKLHPAQTADFPTEASRPAYSVLDSSRFERSFRLQMPDWREDLRLTFAPQPSRSLEQA